MARLLLLIPTSSYRTEDFLGAAKKLDIELTVASEWPSSLEAGNPAGLLTLDFRRPETAAVRAAEFARRHPVDAVLGVDEETALAAAVIARALGLFHNPVEAASAARDKGRMRELLRKAQVPVPSFARFSLNGNPRDAARAVDYPCVLKPLTLSAGRGVIRADNPDQFNEAHGRLKSMLSSDETAGPEAAASDYLVEAFVAGTEYALEGLVVDGALRVLALFDKPDPLDGPFFPETIYVTPSRLPASDQKELVSCAARAVEALGLKTGPIHAELRLNEAGPWVIEVAARSIGGRCSRVLRFGTGMSLEEVILRQALKMEVPSLEREKRAAGVFMIPVPAPGMLRDFGGLDEARDVEGVEEVTLTAHKGQEVRPMPEGTPSYLGFIFARAETPEVVEAALREARRRIILRIT